MKFIERFLVLLIIIGIIMRFIDGTSGLFVQSLSTAALALFYMFFCFFLVNDISFGRMFNRTTYYDIERGDVFKSIVAGGIFALALFSILFVTMGVAGSHKVYNGGVIICVVHFVIARNIYNSYKIEPDKKILIRSGILVTVLLLVKIVELTILKRMG